MYNNMKKFTFKGKKVIIFDLDGTIVRLSADWNSLKNMIEENYVEIYGERGEFNRISAYLNDIVDKKDEMNLKKFFNIIKRYELENIKETQPIKETLFFIKNKEKFGVEKGTKLTILSLNTRTTILESLKLVSLMEQIDYIIGREDVRKWKPNPEGIFKIQDHYKIKKEEMIFFGDLQNDIQTGERAGIDTFFIDDLINLVKIYKKNRNI